MAFSWLERAYDQGNPDLIELNSEVVLDVLRDDPRFSDLMRRMAGACERVTRVLGQHCLSTQ